MKCIDKYIIEKLHIDKDTSVNLPTLDVDNAKKLQFTPSEVGDLEKECERFSSKPSLRISKSGGIVIQFHRKGHDVHVTKPPQYHDECYRIRWDDGRSTSHPYQYPPTDKYKNAKGEIILPTISSVVDQIIKYANKHYNMSL